MMKGIRVYIAIIMSVFCIVGCKVDSKLMRYKDIYSEKPTTIYIVPTIDQAERPNKKIADRSYNNQLDVALHYMPQSLQKPFLSKGYYVIPPLASMEISKRDSMGEAHISDTAMLKHFAEEYGVEKINEYLQEFNYDFFIEYGSESKGEGLTVTVGSDDKIVFFKRKSFPIPSVFFDESQGNQVFADMLPQLISVIEKPGMLVFDEFGNGLHNKLAEKIIRFFMKNASNSQVFITSHDTNLISNSVFRPDQINVVVFDDSNGSKVTRVSKYKPREAQNMEKMYLGGMFEGLPIYEEL